MLILVGCQKKSYRTQYSERMCWMLSSVYLESGYDLLPCICGFPDRIYRICLEIVFNWSVLRTFWKRAAQKLFSMCLLEFTYISFWTQTNFLGSMLSLLHLYIKVYTNSNALFQLPRALCTPELHRHTDRQNTYNCKIKWNMYLKKKLTINSKAN